jgi:hypothetical protein
MAFFDVKFFTKMGRVFFLSNPTLFKQDRLSRESLNGLTKTTEVGGTQTRDGIPSFGGIEVEVGAGSLTSIVVSTVGSSGDVIKVCWVLGEKGLAFDAGSST